MRLKTILLFFLIVTIQHEAKARGIVASYFQSEYFSMIPVKGGCFRIGESREEICLKDFEIGKYEVTQREWVHIMGYNPSAFEDCLDCPVQRISWDEIQSFIFELNEASCQKFRLPTEAEWEFACLSGGREQAYCGGENLASLGWYEENSSGWHWRNSFDRNQSVGGKQPNELGIHDMTGNVWEWVQDSFNSNQKKSEHDRPDPVRVIRGCSSRSSSKECLSLNRSGNSRVNRSPLIGFRLARDSTDDNICSALFKGANHSVFE